MSEPSHPAGREAAFEEPIHVRVAERSHEWVRQHLDELRDGSLTSDQQAAIQEHLSTCPPCQAFERTYWQTVRLTETLPPVKAPVGAKQRILDALP